MDTLTHCSHMMSQIWCWFFFSYCISHIDPPFRLDNALQFRFRISLSPWFSNLCIFNAFSIFSVVFFMSGKQASAMSFFSSGWTVSGKLTWFIKNYVLTYYNTFYIDNCIQFFSSGIAPVVKSSPSDEPTVCWNMWCTKYKAIIIKPNKINLIVNNVMTNIKIVP